MKSWQKYAHVVCIVFSVLALSTLARAQQPFSPRVPIKIPAGTLGVQPNLALVYTPNAGNGLVGMGWSLAGLSEITRVNYGNGINFDAHDTFAHSDVGVLVRQADQPDSSGVNQPTYRSKKESFMRFQQYGGSCPGGDPCYWIATDRSGTRYYYGNYGSDSSGQLATQDSAHIKSWALMAVVDLFGNYYTVS